jgi:5-oxoprolinase (ATP-hydrolysing) subunit C
VVRVIPGPQDDYFTPEAMSAFLTAEWMVTRETDRMGLRLNGPVLAHAKGANIVSDGIAPGAIQVPGNGLPIILLADRQTTGGYPKIATVISADLPALGRVVPGTKLRFEPVTLEEAEAARAALEGRMRTLPDALVAARLDAIDASRLMTVNLISGVTDGSLDRELQ